MKFIKFYNDGANGTVISELANKFNIDEKVMEIIYAKGYKTEEDVSVFLNAQNQPFVDPFKLSGMKECSEKIKQAVKDKKDILIFGDYDVDGISATAIMLNTLKKMGITARYYLPNRFVDGYGLTNAVIDKICANKKPDLIITVDCGITCAKEVEYCRQLGIDIVITDHHEIGDELPKTIIVNPKLENQEYTFNGLCGTGVAFKLAQALVGENECEDQLPIAAIATIADIVPLTSENRIIVTKGLKLFNRYLPVGLKTLIKESKLNMFCMDATTIAFKLAPKLNASGRMGDAADSLKLYLEKDPVKIKELIEKINAHNTKRQDLGNKIYDDCEDMLKNKNMSTMPAIILKSDEWDSGILGIVCSKILEKYNRPVILFSESDGELKGSARSIEDVNIHQVLNSVKDLLEVFGGHKVAAGLTMLSKNFDSFVNRVNSYIIQNINTKAFIPIDYYDVEIKTEDLTEKFMEDLKLLEPCGCDNQKPKFLISSNKIHINPLKTGSTHAYISIDKKLNILFFNYVKEYAMLNFGKNFKFIFELQSLSKGVYKGIIKNFTVDHELASSSYCYFNSLKFNQFKYLDYKKEDISNVNVYKESELTNFVVSCSASSLGTCFISFNLEKYNNFISSYDLSNIYEINFLEGKYAGFNALSLCPNDISWTKSYKKIIFLDTVLDMSYISAIKAVSNAEIYIPEIGAEDKKLFENLYIERNNFSFFYSNILKLEGKQFVSIFGVYSAYIKELKNKINFNNFIIYYFVLNELKIINPVYLDGFYSFTINKNIKTELNNSKIFNSINLLRRIYGKN